MKDKLRTNNRCALAWLGIENLREHVSKLRCRAAAHGESQVQERVAFSHHYKPSQANRDPIVSHEGRRYCAFIKSS